jgi:adenylate cyclase
VTARLVRADTGYQMWAERYDRELADLFDVQEDISRNITAALRVVFDPHGAEPGRRTGSARAYDLRLQGLAHMRRFEAPDMRRAVELLREALREDPHYALARAALAEAEVQLICKEWETDPAWLDRAEADARGALEIAPRLPEAHSALGHLMFHRRRPAEAIRAYQTSVDIDPSHAEGLLKLGNAYLFIGDATRAEIYARRAQAADPSDDRCTAVLVTILVRQRRLREAREVARRIGAPVKINHMTMVRDLVLSHAWEGDMDEALRAADVVRERFPREEAFTASVRAVALAYAGRLDEARALIEPAPDDAIHNSDVHLTRARVRVLLGDREGALRSIEHAERLVLVDIDELRTDPQLATLWDDPLVRRIVADRNLPWRPA